MMDLPMSDQKVMHRLTVGSTDGRKSNVILRRAPCAYIYMGEPMQLKHNGSLTGYQNCGQLEIELSGKI